MSIKLLNAEPSAFAPNTLYHNQIPVLFGISIQKSPIYCLYFKEISVNDLLILCAKPRTEESPHTRRWEK